MTPIIEIRREVITNETNPLIQDQLKDVKEKFDFIDYIIALIKKLFARMFGTPQQQSIMMEGYEAIPLAELSARQVADHVVMSDKIDRIGKTSRKIESQFNKLNLLKDLLTKLSNLHPSMISLSDTIEYLDANIANHPTIRQPLEELKIDLGKKFQLYASNPEMSAHFNVKGFLEAKLKDIEAKIQDLKLTTIITNNDINGLRKISLL